jgi:hypothetical protein
LWLPRLNIYITQRPSRPGNVITSMPQQHYR